MASGTNCADSLADRLVVDAELVGDLLLDVAVFEIGAGGTGGGLRVADQGRERLAVRV